MKNSVIAIIGLLILLGSVGCDQKPATVENPASSSLAMSNGAVAVAPVTNEFAVLKGRWQRGDGDYVIEIRSADAGGKLEARYFNPRPINVSQAQASRKDDSVRVFVELRDVNYPGSTYQLTYDAKADQLFGTYYQAAIKQSFDVAFGRAR